MNYTNLTQLTLLFFKKLVDMQNQEQILITSANWTEMYDASFLQTNPIITNPVPIQGKLSENQAPEKDDVMVTFVSAEYIYSCPKCKTRLSTKFKDQSSIGKKVNAKCPICFRLVKLW